MVAADDLTEIHISSNDARGYPKDSGRAEITGLTVIIIYICHLLEWYNINTDTPIPVYCDNQEAVAFANKRWIGPTPKWADARNVEMKMTIKELLEKHGRRLRIEHVAGHQDRTVEFDDLTLPAKVNVLCDRECERRLKDENQTTSENETRDKMAAAVATLMIDGVPVTTGYREALSKKNTLQR